MKKAFGIFELLLVLVVVLVLYFMFSPKGGNKNPFEEIKYVDQNEQIIDEKIEQINDAKALRNKIEHNMMNEY